MCHCQYQPCREQVFKYFELALLPEELISKAIEPTHSPKQRRVSSFLHKTEKNKKIQNVKKYWKIDSSSLINAAQHHVLLTYRDYTREQGTAHSSFDAKRTPYVFHQPPHPFRFSLKLSWITAHHLIHEWDTTQLLYQKQNRRESFVRSSKKENRVVADRRHHLCIKKCKTMWKDIASRAEFDNMRRIGLLRLIMCVPWSLPSGCLIYPRTFEKTPFSTKIHWATTIPGCFGVSTQLKKLHSTKGAKWTTVLI